MSAPAAIRATFAEWRMVKTRKVLALIFEVPLEQQADVLTILGAPMPDAEIWCGIARLELRLLDGVAPLGPAKVSTEPLDRQSVDQPRSERAKAAYAQATPGEQAVTRAALLPEDARFRSWAVPTPEGGHNRFTAVELAEQFIRDRCCHGESRKLIAEDADCLARFLALEVDYKIFSGQMPEPR